MNSSILQSNKEEFKKLSPKLLKWLATEKTETLISAELSKYTNSFVSKDQLRTLINKLLTSDKTDKLLWVILDELSNNWTSKYAQAQSYDQLLKTLFSNETFKNAAKEPFKEVFKELINNSEFKTSLSKIISSFLNNETLKGIFEGLNNKEEFVKNLLGLIDVFDKHLDFSNVLFETVANTLKTDGINISINSLVSQALNSITNKLNGADRNDKIFKLIQDLLKSDFLTKNKDDIKKIVQNALKILGTDETSLSKIISAIPATTKEQINKYVSDNDLKTLIKTIFSNKNFTKIVNSLTDLITNDKDELAKARNLSELLRKALVKVKPDELKTNVKGLISDLLTKDELKAAYKNILKTTLKTHGVNVDDQNVNKTIDSLINNLNSIVNSVDIVDPALNLIFDKLNKTSPENTDLIEELTKIGPELVKLFNDKIKNNIPNLVKSVLKHLDVTNNKEGIIIIATSLYNHFANNGQLSTLLFNNVIKLETNNVVLKYISNQDLKSLLWEIMKNKNTQDIVKNSITSLLDNQSWIDSLNSNSFDQMILSIVKNGKLIEKNKDSVIKLITDLASNDSFNEVLVKVVDNLISKYNLNIIFKDKKAFLKSLTKDLIDIFKEKSLLNDILDKLISNSNSANSIIYLVNGIDGIVSEKLIKNPLDLFKKIISSPTFNDKKEDTKVFLKSLFVEIFKAQDISSDIATFLVNGIIPSEYKIDQVSLKQSLLNLANSTNYKNLINLVVDELVDHNKDYASATDINDLFKKFLNKEAFVKNFAPYLAGVINDILSDEHSRKVLSQVISHELKKLPENWLLKEINSPEEFIADALDSFKIINAKLNLSKKAIDNLVRETKKDGTQFSFKNVLNGLANDLSTELNSTWETKLLDLIKTLKSSKLFNTKHKDNFKKLLKNVFDYLNKDQKIAEMIYSSIPQKTKDELKGFIEESEIKSLVSKIFKHAKVIEITHDGIDYLFNNLNQIDNAKNLLDIIKIFITPEEKSNKLISHLNAIIKDTLNEPETKKLVKNSLTKFIKYIGLDENDNDIKQFNEKISDGLGQLLVDMGIVDSIVNGFVKEVKSRNNLIDLVNNIQSTLTYALKFNDYDFVAKLLNQPLVSNNKELIKKVLVKVLEKLVSNDTKLKSTLASFSIANSISKEGNINSEKIDNMFAFVLKSNHFKEIVKAFIDEFIGKNQDYVNLHSWPEAIAKF
ncbi:hypothetical protein, partial [Mycoplasmopsis alligatoris]